MKKTYVAPEFVAHGSVVARTLVSGDSTTKEANLSPNTTTGAGED